MKTENSNQQENSKSKLLVETSVALLNEKGYKVLDLRYDFEHYSLLIVFEDGITFHSFREFPKRFDDMIVNDLIFDLILVSERPLPVAAKALAIWADNLPKAINLGVQIEIPAEEDPRIFTEMLRAEFGVNHYYYQEKPKEVKNFIPRLFFNFAIDPRDEEQISKAIIAYAKNIEASVCAIGAVR